MLRPRAFLYQLAKLVVFVGVEQGAVGGFYLGYVAVRVIAVNVAAEGVCMTVNKPRGVAGF